MGRGSESARSASSRPGPGGAEAERAEAPPLARDAALRSASLARLASPFLVIKNYLRGRF